jgi:hypothetical protein
VLISSVLCIFVFIDSYCKLVQLRIVLEHHFFIYKMMSIIEGQVWCSGESIFYL